MKYYIVAGEASGDLHGANLMAELYKKDTEAQIRFWGGDLMKKAGGTLVSHYKERAFMGFAEVLINIRKIIRFIKLCKKDLKEFNPDVLILIDNSGFNLRIAKWAKKQGIRVVYYISPQVWASRAYRVKAIKRDVDQMIVILPFEKEFYKKYNYKVSFVGHPLIDAFENRKLTDERKFKEEHNLGEKPIIAILPGSRKQEISKMLPLMATLANDEDFSKYQFVIAGAPSQKKEFYKQFTKGKKIKLINNKTYDLLTVSYAALVTSGTATLETALFKVPQVVCYKASKVSYLIAKQIITLRFISLVNLIMGKEVVAELIQNKFNKKNLKQELLKILSEKHRKKMFINYFNLEQKLGGKGASKKAAELIINQIKK